MEAGYYPQPMVGLIAERIAEMRKEIAHIQALNKMESRSAPYQNRKLRGNGELRGCMKSWRSCAL